MDVVIIRPDNQKQFLALKAFAKALDLDFKVKASDNFLLEELQEAVEEVKLIKAGKLKGRPAEDLLNEL